MRLIYLQNHLPRRIAPRPGARFGDVMNAIYKFKGNLSSSGGEGSVVWPETGRSWGLAYPLPGALSAAGCSVLNEVLTGTP